MDQAKVFFNDILAPLLPAKSKNQRFSDSKFTEFELKEMFADIDRDGSGTIEKAEMASFMVEVILNKDQVAAKNEYITKLTEYKQYIENQIDQSSKLMKLFYKQQQEKSEHDPSTDESLNPQKIFEKTQKTIAEYSIQKIDNRATVQDIIEPYFP